MTIVTFVSSLAAKFVDYDDKTEKEIEATARDARLYFEENKDNSVYKYANHPLLKLALLIAFPIALAIIRNKINQNHE